MASCAPLVHCAQPHTSVVLTVAPSAQSSRNSTVVRAANGVATVAVNSTVPTVIITSVAVTALALRHEIDPLS